MPRVVVDANVLVSAFIRPDSTPRRVLEKFLEGSFELLLAPEIVAQLRRALGYEKVKRYLGVSTDEIEASIVALQASAVPVVPKDVPRVVPDDPDDDVYIAVALEGMADYIVSGDKHLLDLGSHEDIAIVTPAAFIALIERS